MTAYHQHPPLGHGANRSCYAIVAAWREGEATGYKFDRLLLGAATAQQLIGSILLADLVRFRDRLSERLGHDVVVEVVPDAKLFPPHNAIWTDDSWRQMKRRHEEQNA